MYPTLSFYLNAFKNIKKGKFYKNKTYRHTGIAKLICALPIGFNK